MQKYVTATTNQHFAYALWHYQHPDISKFICMVTYLHRLGNGTIALNIHYISSPRVYCDYLKILLIPSSFWQIA